MAAGLKSAAPKTFKGRRSRLSRWIHDGPPCLWPLLLSLLLATCSSQADNLGESLLFLFFNGYSAGTSATGTTGFCWRITKPLAASASPCGVPL